MKDNFSENVKSLLLDSWTVGTKKQYNVYLTKWFEYCTSNKISPESASVKDGAEFLANLFFTTDCEYSAMNTARSALSTVFPTVNGMTFGKQPVIKRLLRGMFKRRPSLPKYTMTFDVDIVFRYITSLPSLEKESQKMISCRLATLLALLSGQRSQTIAALSIDSMHIEANKCIFMINKLLKQSRPGYHQQPLEFIAFASDSNLCVVKTLMEYLKRTESLRGDEKQLFISFAKPYSAVKSCTLAKWVCCILHNAGVDTKVFSAHSTRAASTSKALSRGLSLGDIGRAAGWSNTSTFTSYYNKPITKNFGESLM